MEFKTSIFIFKFYYLRFGLDSGQFIKSWNLYETYNILRNIRYCKFSFSFLMHLF